jgi:hypothetical protein
VLQTDLGPQLLEQVKREAGAAGLSASGYVRMLVKQRVLPVSEKGGSKKANPKRGKVHASSR